MWHTCEVYLSTNHGRVSWMDLNLLRICTCNADGDATCAGATRPSKLSEYAYTWVPACLLVWRCCIMPALEMHQPDSSMHAAAHRQIDVCCMQAADR